MRVPNDPSKGKKRPLRVAAEILRDLPDILRRHAELPSGLIVSVTEVTLNDDLSLAKIFFSVYGINEERLAKSVEQSLNAKRGVIRHELAQRLIMRQHPDLRFIYDATPARAARIEQLLKQARDMAGPTGEDGE